MSKTEEEQEEEEKEKGQEEKEAEGKRGETLCPLVHSPNGQNGWNQKSGVASQSLSRATQARVLEPLSTTFPDSRAEWWIESRVAKSQTGALYQGYCCRWQLNSQHQASSLISIHCEYVYYMFPLTERPEILFSAIVWWERESFHLLLYLSLLK